MNISYKWLCDYLPKKISVDELSVLLTQIGLEVEEVNAYESIQGALDGLVIGRVERVEPIPKADKIRLTHVCIQEGSDTTLPIVCGAANVREGALVVVALPETTLYPVDGEPFTIKQAHIRGIQSCGMLCSEKEIGLSDRNEGIIVLEHVFPLGTPASEVFEIYTDTIFKINLTANRNDSMSHFGIARDICAYWSYHQNQLCHPILPAIKHIPLAQHAEKPAVHITVASPACKRYSMMVVDNMRVENAPQWMKHRMQAIGQKSISNVVDVTNYILHELGQPLHAFDCDHIDGNQIIVKQGLDSAFITLDNTSRKLHPDDLLICNASEPMCIAGVFGGLTSGISSNTKKVAFESAYFEPAIIRKTSLRHQLRTEAAVHFEKQVDIEKTIFALQRLAYLLEQIGFVECLPIVDIYTPQHTQKPIALSTDYLQKVTGHQYTASKIEKLWHALEFTIVESKTIDGQVHWMIEPPAYRSDVAHPADLVEEIVRIDGLNEIPIPSEMTHPFQHTPAITLRTMQRKLADLFCGMGFYEAIHNSIVSEKWFDKQQATNSNSVFLLNSLSIDHTLLRPHMMPAGLTSIAFNINRKRPHVKLFEFGKTYQKDNNGKYVEANKLAFWLTGNWERDHWQTTPAKTVSFQHAVGLIEAIADMTHLNDSRTMDTNDYCSTALRFDNNTSRTWAFVGQVAESYLRDKGIKQPVFYVEVDMDELLRHQQTHTIVYKEPSKFHDVRRDIAFFINGDVAFQSIKSAILALQLSYLARIELFDIFQHHEGKRSYAIRLYFRAHETTLTDEQCNQQVNEVITCLETSFAAQVRRV